ncbi:endolytic transglycosylase MltG [uncultured Mailhella sp.]|uniref:endolytic transglycosylase MltG n=1 Tax=uncultured Mailhella sp. TaxID=1981031 RepID=UPI0025E3F4C5|nr:endolytic transglycosylase MltG [uncultured Mailhella sp.]
MTPEKTENETPLNDSPITGSAFEKTDEPSTEDTPAGQNKKPQAPRRRRRPLLWLMVFVLMVCLGAGTWAWRDARNFLDTPPQDPGKSLIVDIEPGMTLAQVAAMLEKEEVITDAWRFQMLVRYKEKSRNIQAGRFLVSTGWLPETVLDMLVSGKAMLYRLTIREGLAWWDVAELVEDGGFCKAADFTSVIHDPEFLRHWGIPFDSAEGFLYPETYLLPRPRELNRDAAKAVANRLVEMFWRRADKLWPNGKRPSTEELKRLVTLASIVEKETSVPEERARVAGVYANRLEKNMLLQADPTVIYGLGRSFEGPLLRSQLDNANNRYNTYQNPGLPPGPICSFGSSALKAAISPEKHDYLYFVATGRDRGHTFSKNLNDHNRAVRNYRAALRENKK